MRSLVFDAISDYRGAEDGKLTFDYDGRDVYIVGEVEDDCYNFKVKLTDADCRILMDWLTMVRGWK